VIEAARHAHPTEPFVFRTIGEVLDTYDDPAHAARWLTTGLVRRAGSLAEITAAAPDWLPTTSTPSPHPSSTTRRPRAWPARPGLRGSCGCSSPHSSD